MTIKTKKSQQADFGAYHHSTPRGSQKIRQKVKMVFTKVFGFLPFRRDDKLKILDVGCGLGFLSCVCAEYYPKARITGFDTFKHASDLFVSNLVFHNLGGKRFNAYERVAYWMTSNSYLVLGELFFDYKTDLKQMMNLFAKVEKKPSFNIATQYKLLVLSEPNKYVTKY